MMRGYFTTYLATGPASGSAHSVLINCARRGRPTRVTRRILGVVLPLVLLSGCFLNDGPPEIWPGPVPKRPVVTPPPATVSTATSVTGRAENSPGACSDGLDNDDDTLIDLQDSDCAAFVSPPPPLPVENTAELCADHTDNDQDGVMDLEDPDCGDFFPPPPTPQPLAENSAALCGDGQDNDRDNLIDFNDADCAGFLPSVSIRFDLSTGCVRPAGTITLSWEVTGADSISITAPAHPSQGRSCVNLTCRGSVLMQVFSTTTFTLQARLNGQEMGRASRSILVQPRKFSAKFEQRVAASAAGSLGSLNEAAVTGNKIYLATSNGLYRKTGTGSVVSLAGDGLPNTGMKTVTIDRGNSDIVLTGTTGHIYYSEDEGNHWEVIQVERWQGDNLVDMEVFSVASLDGNYIAGTNRGIIVGELGDGWEFSDIISGDFNKVFVRSEGFFAMSEEAVYWSDDGQDWSSPELEGFGPLFFEKAGSGSAARLFAVSEEGSWWWNNGSWISYDGEVDLPGNLRAVGHKEGLGWLAVAGNEVWLKPEGETDWIEAELTGSIPEIGGLQTTSSSGKNYVWGPGGVYEWQVSEVPLFCPQLRVIVANPPVIRLRVNLQ